MSRPPSVFFLTGGLTDQLVLFQPDFGKVNYRTEDDLGVRITSDSAVSIYGGTALSPPNMTNHDWLHFMEKEQVSTTILYLVH